MDKHTAVVFVPVIILGKHYIAFVDVNAVAVTHKAKAIGDFAAARLYGCDGGYRGEIAELTILVTIGVVEVALIEVRASDCTAIALNAR
jgi:hypothetical protein